MRLALAEAPVGHPRAHRYRAHLAPVPTQFKATQLVVAIAVWAIPGGLSITYRSYCVFNLSILLLNNASEQYYTTIG